MRKGRHCRNGAGRHCEECGKPSLRGGGMLPSVAKPTTKQSRRGHSPLDCFIRQCAARSQ
ncbi:MAG: hypothetical protein LBT00_10235 [Spirochaetaceae bacterium]|nr:hypothetical protein [Spirochaetaceae bacterium]